MDLILFILVLGINILIHEYAHFYFARKAGILCHEFAIGMGPAIYQKKKGETLYAVRAIPLGGYVAMAGETVSEFVRVGQNVGIKLDEDGFVSQIILTNEIGYDFIGKVESFDLYGKDNAELFIELNISGTVSKYPVRRDADYILTPKKKLQLAPAERSYENKTIWQRFLVVFAGPASNFLLAFFILFILAFFIGKPTNKNVVGSVDENMIGNKLVEGDTITSINGNKVETWNEIGREIYKNKNTSMIVTKNDGETFELDLLVVFQGLGFTNMYQSDELIVGEVFGRSKDLQKGDKINGILLADKKKSTDPYVLVNTWEELINYLSEDGIKEKKNVYMEITREEKTLSITYENISGKTLAKLDSPYVGYSAGIGELSEFNILYPLYYPFQKLGSDIKQMFNTIVLLFNPVSGVGVKDLAGPVGIFSMVSNARKQGFISFMTFFAFLSINVGFLNLLPIPALDGGRLAFLAYEGITKKKVNKNVENAFITITFILLLILMIFVTYQDIIRLFIK
jgi:regulator of sigma E protease